MFGDIPSGWAFGRMGILRHEATEPLLGARRRPVRRRARAPFRCRRGKEAQGGDWRRHARRGRRICPESVDGSSPVSAPLPLRGNGGGSWENRARSTRRSSSGAPCSRTTRGGTAYAEVAREIGVDPSSLADWVRRAPAAAPDAEADPFQMAGDLRRPRRGNERLERENEMLLEASAFLAGRQP